MLNLCIEYGPNKIVSFFSLPRIIHRSLPIRPLDESTLEKRDRYKARTRPNPQSRQAQLRKAKCQEQCKWDGEDIVYAKVDESSNELSAKTAHKTITQSRCGIEKLRSSDDRHHLGDLGVDFWILGKENGDVVFECDEECDVKDTDADEDDGVEQSRCSSGAEGTVTNEIAEASGRCDADWERDVVHEHADRHQDRLGGEMHVREVCGTERQDIEC